VQVVIALVVTPQGFPLAYEVMAGNTQDSSTLKEFLDKIEKQYGKAQRIWLMDRGIPTEPVLEQMRQSDPPVKYLVRTPQGRLTSLESGLLDKPWQQMRPGVEVKLLTQPDELYVLAQSADRVQKERSMRRRQLKWLWSRLKKLSTMKLKREELLMKLGAAKQKSPSAYCLVKLEVDKEKPTLTYRLDREKLRRQRRREERYLLRTNLTETDPSKLWSLYLQLVNVEEAFKNLKGDLAIRPIFHQSENRIEAHILISFLAYCLHITLTERLRALAPGLTARSALEKFASMQMIDVHVPTTDGRELVMTRTTQPQPELQLLLEKLKLQLPAQPPQKITSAPLASVAAL
jgi:transposase